MMKKKVGAILFFASFFCGSMFCAAQQSKVSDDGYLQPEKYEEKELDVDQSYTYRPYFYNYPHAIPPDYVFRTGRVFSPTNMKAKGAPASANQDVTATVNVSGQGGSLAKQVRELGRQLLATSGEDVRDEYAVTVSTFVNLNNLYATSAFGRYLSEQLVTELQQQGLEVVEVRKTPGIMISKGHGEYGLSRDMDELSFAQDAQAMVVGTYTVAEGEIMINARLLRNGDNMVLSSASLVLPVTNLTARLLADEGVPVGSGTTVSLQGFDEEKLGQ